MKKIAVALFMLRMILIGSLSGWAVILLKGENDAKENLKNYAMAQMDMELYPLGKRMEFKLATNDEPKATKIAWAVADIYGKIDKLEGIAFQDEVIRKIFKNIRYLYFTALVPLICALLQMFERFLEDKLKVQAEESELREHNKLHEKLRQSILNQSDPRRTVAKNKFPWLLIALLPFYYTFFSKIGHLIKNKVRSPRA